MIRKTLMGALLAAGLFCGPARAQSEASAALSLLPVASVVASAGGASAAAGAVVALPAALSVGGAVLTVVAVEASATGTVYVLERASDGAQASVEVYEKQLREIVAKLKATGARLVFATTTPVPEEPMKVYRKNADVIRTMKPPCG